jgi:hypothetical protein
VIWVIQSRTHQADFLQTLMLHRRSSFLGNPMFNDAYSTGVSSGKKCLKNNRAKRAEIAATALKKKLDNSQ